MNILGYVNNMQNGQFAGWGEGEMQKGKHNYI